MQKHEKIRLINAKSNSFPVAFLQAAKSAHSLKDGFPGAKEKVAGSVTSRRQD